MVPSLLVVYAYPSLRLCADGCQRPEDSGIEHFDAIGSVESLDVGVLSRTTWLDVIPSDVVGVGPRLHDMKPERCPSARRLIAVCSQMRAVHGRALRISQAVEDFTNWRLVQLIMVAKAQCADTEQKRGVRVG